MEPSIEDAEETYDVLVGATLVPPDTIDQNTPEFVEIHRSPFG